MENAYFSLGSDSSISHTLKGQNANSFVMQEHKVSFYINVGILQTELLISLLRLVQRILICQEHNR